RPASNVTFSGGPTPGDLFRHDRPGGAAAGPRPAEGGGCVVRNRAQWLALLLGVALLAAGCGSTGGSSSGPVYVVGTEAAYPPFEMINEQTQEFEGFDIELMQAVAEEAGFQVQFQNLAWDALVPALQAGQIDLII